MNRGSVTCPILLALLLAGCQSMPADDGISANLFAPNSLFLEPEGSASGGDGADAPDAPDAPSGS